MRTMAKGMTSKAAGRGLLEILQIEAHQVSQHGEHASEHAICVAMRED